MSRTIRTILVAGAVAVASLALTLLVLAGCGGAAGGSGKAALDGTRWRLTGWTLSSPDPRAFTITAAFAGGKISGTSAVNSYGGPYTTGAGNAFSVGDLAQTEMAGPAPAMRAEAAYMKLLGGAASYRLSGGTLTLYDKAGTESLIFRTARP